jgi:hypothetical protein
VRQVWSHDTYGRNALAGYGFCHIPTMPGTYALDVHCWRPKPQSWLEYLSGFFLGAYAQLRNPDLVWRQDDRYRLSTVATGTVRLEVRAPCSLLAARRARTLPARRRPRSLRAREPTAPTRLCRFLSSRAGSKSTACSSASTRMPEARARRVAANGV